MTDKERLKRYAVIVKWGTDYLDSIDSWIKEEHRPSLDFERELLEEYVESFTQLKEQLKN